MACSLGREVDMEKGGDKELAWCEWPPGHQSPGRFSGLGYEQGLGFGLRPWSIGGGLCQCLWLLSPLEFMQRPVILVATLISEGCTAARVMPLWVVCMATWGHGNNLAQAASQVHGPVSARVWIDIPGPCCCQRPHGCPGSKLQTVTMLVSDWGQTDLRGKGCQLGPWYPGLGINLCL